MSENCNHGNNDGEVIIDVKNLHKNYGHMEVIKGVDLTVRKGEVICIIGPSGAGKSTMLRCLNGLEQASSGQIVVNGHDLGDPHVNIDQVREQVGMVFQHFNVFPNLTVLENVTLAPVLEKKVPKDQAKEEAMALLRRVGEKAAELGAVPAAVTFDTHPENLILKTPAVPLLSSPLDRAELMRRFYGIREVIVAHFDERMMHMPWREFVTDYLAGEHGAVHLVAGHDFHFGYKGEGNPERLQALCGELGIGCDLIPKVVQDHITISSTYIRTLVAQGEMERANQFLGHPHTLTDTVAHGKKLGGTLGFPTVNLRFQPGVLVPAHGVYATRVTFENGESRPAVTNIGVRPTVDDGDRVTVEGFILDFQGDLYGQTVRMEFYKRLRGERKFPSLEALKDEVMRNAEQTRAYFSTQP